MAVPSNWILSGRFLLLAGIAFLCVPSSISEASPPKRGDCELCECSPPDLWVVSTRCAPRCCGLDAGFEKLTYERWDAQRKVFIKESRESFLMCQSNIPTLLFSHGNSLDPEAALEACWKMYNAIKVCPGPKMMVFWTWPAELLIKRPLARPIQLARKNIKAKYVYAEYQGYYIAKLTDMMSTAQPLTLSGHSYGAVTVICALHYLGGGQLNNLVLDVGAPVERPNLRGVMISPALDNDHVYPGHRYGQSFAPVEKFYTTYNDRDSTLKRWPTHSFRGQESMGYTGVCASRLGPYAHKLCQHKLTEDVKRSHYMRPHLASNRMMTAVCQTAFETCPSCGANGGRGSIFNFAPESIIEVPTQTVFPGLAL